MIVLDASVVIAHLESTDAHHHRATELLVDTAEEPWGASPITLAEILVGPARTGRLDAARASIDLLGIRSIAFDDQAPARLAMLRATTRLPMPDCCVLLAAESAAGELATFDERLTTAAATFGLTVRT